MKKATNLLFLLALLLALIGTGIWLVPVPEFHRPTAKSDPATRNQTSSSADSSAAWDKGSAASNNITAFSAATIELLGSILDKPVQIDHGGALRDLVLAKDELYVRDSEGSGRVVPVPSSKSARELLDRVQEIQQETGVSPELVLYPAGLPRNDATRRIVTREVMLEADSRSTADAVAAASNLAFKDAPTFAPGKFIYTAASSPDALAFFVKTAQSESPYVTPLLASRAFPMSLPNDALFSKQWHLRFQNQLGAVQGTDINVTPLWSYPSSPWKKAFDFNSSNNTHSFLRGNNVVIGIVDDGMEWSHPDLVQNVRKNLQRDWNGQDFDPTPDPAHSHGTACAGVAAARGNNRLGVCGVAPEAFLAGMRLIAAPQTDLDIAEAMTWKLNDIHVKNNSWGDYAFATDTGGPTGLFRSWNPIQETDVLTEAALEYATKYGRNGKGSILVFAAGNHDELTRSRNLPPEKSGARVDFQALPNSIHTIAVGAVNSVGVKSNYSQIGSSLIVSAPSNTTDGSGLGIMTTDNKGKGGYNYGSFPVLPFRYLIDDFKGSADLTQNFGGTSSATPVVSGVVALMLQRNPNLGWRDVQEILIQSANRTFDPSAVWTTNAAGIQFSDNYGAGLVDASAAVALSGNWTNLTPQQSRTATRTVVSQIAPAATVSRTFTINGTNLRTEHATLELTVTDIPKGNLTITLTSPQNTVSTFCLPHSDNVNTFTDWKFMTVRNWGEDSNGTWRLDIINSGNLTGNLTRAELVVYGSTPVSASNVVTVTPSTTYTPLGSNITLNATATSLAPNGTLTGNITGVRFFYTLNGTGNATLIGNGTLSANSSRNPATYSLLWNTANLTAGNYFITANASANSTSSGNVTGTSPAVVVTLEPRLLAGWDFQTSTVSTVPLINVLYSTRSYRANFGTGNGTLLVNGSNGSSRWDVAAGEISAGDGSLLNTGAGFSRTTTTPAALRLRAGRNRSGNGKSLVFQVNMTNARRLEISYAATATAHGFTTHTWEYLNTQSNTWLPIATRTLAAPSGYAAINLPVAARPNFDGQANARVRLTVSGATRVEGTNVIDNIRFTAVAAP